MLGEKKRFVYVIDEDREARWRRVQQLDDAGLLVQGWATLDEYLAAGPAQRPGVVLVALRTTRTLGALRALLHQIQLPVVAMVENIKVGDAVDLMRRGASDVLGIDAVEGVVLERIAVAAIVDEQRCQTEAEYLKLQQAMQRLTPRERDVLSLLMAGRQNKDIASELDVSLRTVEVHRSRIMRKFEAANGVDLAVKATRMRDLAELALRCDLPATRPVPTTTRVVPSPHGMGRTERTAESRQTLSGD
ncbi:MAG: hypothetical protein KDA61_16555 [Planctomycetales bacterium]|nr:hypothetical protein [Planctomycetales bacterium]